MRRREEKGAPAAGENLRHALVALVSRGHAWEDREIVAQSAGWTEFVADDGVGDLKLIGVSSYPWSLVERVVFS